MIDDPLAPFLRAYREENRGSALDSASIRRRVIVGIGARQGRRVARLRFVLPVAATFFGSVALAASHGKLAHWESVRQWLGEPALPAPIESPKPKRSGVHRAHAAVPPPAPVTAAPPAAAPPAASVELDELPLVGAPSERPLAPPSTRAPASRPDPLKNDVVAYEKAHRLHFHANDPAAALTAWDAYLAEHPGGVFAPEGRFNRAICLIRLGRRSEAREVLVRISQARPGTFGRERAQALLEAMGD